MAQPQPPDPPIIIVPLLRNHELAQRHPVLQQASIPVPVSIEDSYQVARIAQAVENDSSYGRRIKLAVHELQLRVVLNCVVAPARPPPPAPQLPVRLIFREELNVLNNLFVRLVGIPPQAVALLLRAFVRMRRMMEEQVGDMRRHGDDIQRVFRRTTNMKFVADNQIRQTAGIEMLPVPRIADGRTHPEGLEDTDLQEYRDFNALNVRDTHEWLAFYGLAFNRRWRLREKTTLLYLALGGVSSEVSHVA
ncbi:hypothetical protein IAR55_005093 [Kwoniella newhampshirensis]|uniref:Uncharacterized protein n=1 Tax=Kwoniella newhampshirensis TaxID=1651941 RepID=A0AAW0YUV8_9TREE